MRLLTLILAMVVAGVANAANWYVTQSGGGNGTSWGSPWSVTALNNNWASVNAGDTVWIAGGNYSAFPTPTKSGGAGNPITIRKLTTADTAQLPGSSASFTNAAVFSGRMNSIAGSINNITVNGGEYRGFRFTVPINDQGGSIFDIEFSSNWTIKYCSFQGPGWIPHHSYAIWFRGCTGNVASHNYYDGVMQAISMNGGDGIYEYSEHRNLGPAGDPIGHPDALYAQGFSSIVFRYNYISNCQSECIFIADENSSGSVDVYGNVALMGALGTGRCLESKQGFTWGGPWRVYNNTWVDWDAACNWRGTFVTAPTMRNNLFWHTSWQQSGDYFGPSVSGSATYNGYSGSIQDSSNGYASGTDPFVNSAAGNYRLKAGSWPIGRGTSLGATYNSDMDGATRGADGAWDMGAFEYTGGAVSTNPIIQVTPGTLTFPPALEGAVATNYFTVQNVGAGTLIGGASISGSALGFELINNAYSLAAGQGTNIYVRHTYGVTTPVTKQIDFSGGGGSTNFASATTASLLGMSFPAIVGTITPGSGGATFTTNGGYISFNGDASGTNQMPNGATASYWFNLASNGNYVVRAYAQPSIADGGHDSVWVGMNDTPTDDVSIWDGATVTGWQTNTISWRGNGTPTSPQYSPKVWSNLVAGANQLIVIGREPGFQIQSFVITPSGTNATPPGIVTQPQGRSVVVGSNVLFTVVASGTPPLSYQWKYNTAAISGATASAYTKSNIQEADAGSYSVTITNSAGSTNSANAVVTVSPAPVAPTIQSEPHDATVTAGGSTNFSVTASGYPTPAYQWKHAGTNLSGKTTSSLALSGITASQAGTYMVVITNVAGSTNSANAVLTVNPVANAPSITAQPQDTTVSEGAAASFTVSATGTAPLGYQWRKDGSAISGATATSYAIASAQTSDAADYVVVVSNSVGMVTSEIATLTVVIPPSFVTYPASRTVIVGATNTYSANMAGTAPFAYQWQKNSTNLTGETGSSYVISGLVTNDAGSYRVIVTNSAAAVTSSAAVLTVADPPYIISFPAGTYQVYKGSNLSATVVAGGYTPLAYRWRQNITNLLWLGYGATLTGVASTNYNGSYDVIVSNIAGSVTSSPIVLTVVDPPSGTNIPIVIWSKYYRK